jgi:hypothetical protein
MFNPIFNSFRRGPRFGMKRKLGLKDFFECSDNVNINDLLFLIISIIVKFVDSIKFFNHLNPSIHSTSLYFVEHSGRAEKKV